MKKFNGNSKIATALFSLFMCLFVINGYSKNNTINTILSIEVNGTINPSFQQGVPFTYAITGTDIGGSVMNEMWIDVDSNGTINPAADMLFVAFSQTDGQQSNQGPGDNDGIANGTITTGISGLSFPIGHYIFKTSTTTDIAYATFVITPLLNTTYSVSGTITKGGIGLGGIVVELVYSSGQLFAITNAAGNYTVTTNLNSGTEIEVSIPNDGSFNSTSLAGSIITPNKVSTAITTNIIGADFVISSGKILMGKVVDGSGNPIANMEVSASIQNQNGNGYKAFTDGNGRYIISLQSGDYQVMFGSYNSPKGYLLTAYNQKYTNGNINLIHIASNVDTVKNIDATLYKGALITGTMKNNGSPVQGNISAFDYSNPNNPLYQSGYDGNTGLYYIYVLPGIYSIHFQLNNGGNNVVYYNQTSVSPGTAVVVNNINDTIRNIDVDFGTVASCSTSSVTNLKICQYQLPYNWNSLTFNGAGSQTAHLSNTSGCDSAATLNLEVDTSSTNPPSLSISTTTTICSGNNITFSTTASNLGSSPFYQWKKNGVNVGTGASITFLAGTLATNDLIICGVNANNSCLTINSNPIQLVVNPSPIIGVCSNIATFCNTGVVKNIYNTNTSGGGVWTSNNPYIASVSTSFGATGSVTANHNGMCVLTYTKTAFNGCQSMATKIVTVSQVPTPNAIAGLSTVCVGSTISLSTASVGGVWTSVAGRATINSNGDLTGASAGTASIKYTVSNVAGCSSFVSKSVTVNPIPAVPSIAYGATIVNPQAGAGGGNNFCTNKTFTVVGSPTGGVWSKTGVLSVTNPGGFISTGSVVGFGSLTYTYTSAAGCSSSRSISGNVVTCAAKGVNTVDGQQLTVDGFTMYPNPAKSVVNINVETLIGKGSIVVTDLYGKTVKTQTLSMGTNTVDIANLNKGMYFVSTITNEGKTTKKLVVE